METTSEEQGSQADRNTLLLFLLRNGHFFSTVTEYGRHTQNVCPACSEDIRGSFPSDEVDHRMNVTTHFHLVPKLRMHGPKKDEASDQFRIKRNDIIFG